MNSIVNLVQNMAEEFDSAKDYEVGDYVMYEGLLYLFHSTHIAGEFNADEVVPITLADVMKGTVDSNLGNFVFDITNSETTKFVFTTKFKNISYFLLKTGGRMYPSQYQYIYEYEYDGTNVTYTKYTYTNTYVSSEVLDTSLWSISDGVITLDISTTSGGLWPVLYFEVK